MLFICIFDASRIGEGEGAHGNRGGAWEEERGEDGRGEGEEGVWEGNWGEGVVGVGLSVFRNFWRFFSLGTKDSATVEDSLMFVGLPVTILKVFGASDTLSSS